MMLGASAVALAGCGNGVNSNGRDRIDAQVNSAVGVMQQQLPFTTELMNTAAGVLVMPLVTKAGLIFGGAYGEGSLLIGNAPVDYYSVASASWGLQAGAQQYSSALFFMDTNHLAKFRARSGWTLGADIEFTVLTDAEAAGIDTNNIDEAVYAVVFGQAGILVGVSIEGSKYTRIIRYCFFERLRRRRGPLCVPQKVFRGFSLPPRCTFLHTLAAGFKAAGKWRREGGLKCSSSQEQPTGQHRCHRRLFPDHHV